MVKHTVNQANGAGTEAFSSCVAIGLADLKSVGQASSPQIQVRDGISAFSLKFRKLANQISTPAEFLKC